MLKTITRWSFWWVQSYSVQPFFAPHKNKIHNTYLCIYISFIFFKHVEILAALTSQFKSYKSCWDFASTTLSQLTLRWSFFWVLIHLENFLENKSISKMVFCLVWAANKKELLIHHLFLHKQQTLCDTKLQDQTIHQGLRLKVRRGKKRQCCRDCEDLKACWRDRWPARQAHDQVEVGCSFLYPAPCRWYPHLVQGSLVQEENSRCLQVCEQNQNAVSRFKNNKWTETEWHRYEPSKAGLTTRHKWESWVTAQVGKQNWEWNKSKGKGR